MAAETKGQEAQDVEMSESGKGPEPAIGQVRRCMSLRQLFKCAENTYNVYRTRTV